MAILVTGGAGYIGSVTVETLLSRGEEVVVVDSLVHGHRNAVNSAVPFYQGDVGDPDLLGRIAREHKLESCIHFAGLIEVGESVTDPLKYFNANVAQGIALISNLVRLGVRRLVFSSTCATYGRPEQMPIGEQCAQWPMSPYGWSKLFIERILDSCDSAYQLRFIALRYFNAAGASGACGEDHEPESHLIPNVLFAAMGRLPHVTIFGDDYPTPDGTAIRDYIHVVDLADAHARALDFLRQGGRSQFLNVGTGKGVSVREVIDCAKQVTGRAIPVVVGPRRAGDHTALVADACLIKSVLGWAPTQSDLHSILRSAWDWRVRNPVGYQTVQTV